MEEKKKTLEKRAVLLWPTNEHDYDSGCIINIRNHILTFHHVELTL